MPKKDMLGIAVRKLVTLPAQVLGIVCDLLEKLSDPEWVEALKKFLRKENPWSDIWRTIQIGTHSSIADLRQDLKDADCKASDWANGLLGKMALAELLELLDLEVLTVAELGRRTGRDFNVAARFSQIRDKDKIEAIGLELCPPEVGPQLRLQYLDQPLNECLLIAMEPIADSDGYLGVFGVERDDDGCWLDGDRGDPDNFWCGCSRFVFRRRK